MAQPQREGYNALGGQTQAEVQGDTGVGPAGTDTGGGSDSGSQPVSASANDGAGSLPFTGLDVALLALAGGLLATVGLGMRRLVRSSDVA